MTAPRPTGSIDIWNFVDNVTGTTVRKWLRDSWARKKIVALQQAVAAIVVPTRTSQLTNDSGYITQADVPPGSTPSSTTPLMDGTAAVGTENAFARGDHRHPTDTTRQAALSTTQMAAVNSGVTAAKVQAWDGITVPTKTSDLTNDSGFITASDIPPIPSASSVNPVMDGTASAGSSTAWARGDHVHPSDTNKQDALTTAQLAAVNSGITASDLAVNDASVLCTVTPIVPTLDAGTHSSSYGGCYYYKIGHTVTVHIGVASLTASTDTVIFTLPAGYRPYARVAFVGIGGSMSSYSRHRIDTNGNVHVHSGATSALGYVKYSAFS